MEQPRHPPTSPSRDAYPEAPGPFLADAPPPPAPRRPRRSRPLLHAGLLGATLVTLAFAGGLFWEGKLPGPLLADWLDPFKLLSVLIAGAPYAAAAVLVLGAHEMGHYLACRYYGIPATLPFFIPGPPPLGSFGAVIRIRGIIPHRKALFDVAAAGPIAGFALALPLLIYGFLTAEIVVAPDGGGGAYLGSPLALQLLEPFLRADASVRVNSLFGAGWVGMLVTSLNLFPVGQLDGGHAVYAISHRLHRILARGCLAALLGLVLYQWLGLGQTPAYTIWFVILLWMRDRHPRLLDETSSLGTGRKLVALALLVMFVLSFIPIPFFLAGE